MKTGKPKALNEAKLLCDPYCTIQKTNIDKDPERIKKLIPSDGAILTDEGYKLISLRFAPSILKHLSKK